MREKYSQILTGKVEFPKNEWQFISKEAKCLIRNMLKVNTSERYSTEQILKLNIWLKLYGSKDLNQNLLATYINEEMEALN